MKEYSCVPKIITSKDLDYLTDMFNWFYLVYKDSNNICENITDSNLCKEVKKVVKMLENYLKEILNIIKDGINENK